MLNILQLHAIDIIKSGKSLFLTGPPGVGKSFILRNIILYLDEIGNKYGLTAMTGCAAILIKGKTLHSFLGIGLGNEKVEKLYEKLKDKKKFNELKNLDTLIIDEISMMNDKFFEKISKLLSKIKNNNKPFGDIRLILIGDFYQLPPTDGEYCFKSKLWDMVNMTTVELNESMRQKDDIIFQKLLNNIRTGKITEANYNELKKLNETNFSTIIPTKIYCLKTDVNRINTYYFNKLIMENMLLKSEEVNNYIENNIIECYPNGESVIDGINSIDSLKIFKYCIVTNEKYVNKNDYEVSLIKGAEVMITRNVNIENELVNGKKGKIIYLTNNYVIIKDALNIKHKIEYYKDENAYNKFVKFMPLTLAYAITVHKSQGSTLDYIEIDGSNNNFAPGQFYTALSRAKTLKNIRLKNLDKDALIINKDVLNFYNT
jgi:ATP-dependent DNA helicase PIF1